MDPVQIEGVEVAPDVKKVYTSDWFENKIGVIDLDSLNIEELAALRERVIEKLAEKVAARQVELEAEIARLSQYGKPAKKAAAAPAAKAKRGDEPREPKEPPAAEGDAEAA